MSLPVLLLFTGRIIDHVARVYQLPEQELTRVRHKSSIIGVSWRICHSGRRRGGEQGGHAVIRISVWLHTPGFLVKPGMTQGEGTKAQRHKGGKAQRHTGILVKPGMTQRHTGILVGARNDTRGRHKGTKAQRHKGTKAQRHKGTKAQRGEGTKAQRHTGFLVKPGMTRFLCSHESRVRPAQ